MFLGLTGCVVATPAPSADKHDLHVISRTNAYLRGASLDDDLRDARLAPSNDNRDPHTIVAPALPDPQQIRRRCGQRFALLTEIPILS